MSHSRDAEKYAHEVVGGVIATGSFVRLACQRQINDLKRDFDYEYNEAAANKICNFIELLPHTKGKWAAKKQKIKLEPWQKFLLCTLFGWIHKETGARRFTEAYLEIPRKNGKSIIAAGVGLYCFLACDDYGAEVYCGANTEKQAWEVFRPAMRMCEMTPELVEHYGIDVRAKNLSVIADGARFEPVIGNPADGSSPSLAIVDEFHEHKTSDLYDTMETGMGSRDNPLMFVITTAGIDISSPCYEKRLQMTKLLNGAIQDDSIFTCIYSVDEGVDWSSPEALEMANPNIGVSVNKDFLLAAQKKAVDDVSKQNIFKIKHLNVWTNARETWLNLESWNKCGSGLALEDFEGQPCYIGVDLAQKIDIAAKVLIFPKEQEGDNGQIEKHYYVFPSFYLPLETIQDDRRPHYMKWYTKNLINTNDGAELDYDFIREDIKQDMERFDVHEVVFDPWRSSHLMHELTNEGATCVEFRQTPKNLTEAMREVEAAVKSGRVHHAGNQIMDWMVSNTVCKHLPNEMTVITKEREGNKIDGVSGLVMSIGRAMYSDTYSSVYESRGVLII